MQVLTKRALREFGLQHPDIADEVLAWFNAVEAADWSSGAEVRAFDSRADYVGGDRWVFNLRGNRYRLVVRIFSRPSKFMCVSSVPTPTTAVLPTLRRFSQ